ncbi:uncharacterized protein LOC111098564 isoform X2 [Canis lupus familiaris]|uniref:uncharacterized protein LOC111098564 isoform X2 n=1 Tax=Canis lupus familiaris TaxID=9615 RepID=UPI0018F6FC7C|nr:uncharacterized protein LOC111098564 isoform X2 [Canis lupus familiaris]
MKHYNNDPNLRGLRRLDAIIGNNCKGPSFPMEDGRWLLAERKREKQTCETSLKASALKCHTINSVDTPLAKTSHSAEHNISGTGEVNFREYGCPAFPVWPLVVLCSLLDLSRGRHQCKIGARWQDHGYNSSLLKRRPQPLSGFLHLSSPLQTAWLLNLILYGVFEWLAFSFWASDSAPPCHSLLSTFPTIAHPHRKCFPGSPLPLLILPIQCLVSSRSFL